MIGTEAINKLHSRNEPGFGRRTTDVCEVNISRRRAERANDASVKSNFCCKVGQMEVTLRICKLKIRDGGREQSHQSLQAPARCPFSDLLAGA